jgi:cytidylate kinase
LNQGFVITIDGPAASGKSSVSREIARRFSWKWVSTGAFYRGLGYVAMQVGVNIEDETALAELAHSDIWSVEMGMDRTRVVYNHFDVTSEIGREDVGNIASLVSRFPAVRKALLQGQRDCLKKAQALGSLALVAEGRDCGTVIFPDSPAKVYLTANSASRAQRRSQELGLNVTEIMSAQKTRDHQDSSRKEAPLAVPENALVIDTSELGFEDVVKKVEEFIRQQISLS